MLRYISLISSNVQILQSCSPRGGQDDLNHLLRGKLAVVEVDVGNPEAEFRHCREPRPRVEIDKM